LKSFNSFHNRFRWPRQLCLILIAWLVILCLVCPAHALDPNRRLSQYIHDRWGKDRGFIGDSIYAIQQSADGYLWIGTEQGLVRFDGSSFAFIDRPLPNMPPIGPVRDLVSDRKGSLWIRLNGPRLLLYHSGIFEDPSTRLDLQDITFTAMSADHDGGILLSGLGEKILRLQGDRLDTMLSAEQSPGTVTSTAETPDQSVWLGTQNNGLFRLRQGHLSSVAHGLKDLKINCVFPADSGGLWVGTDHGLHLWEGGSLTRMNSLASLAQLQVLTITRDHDANVWVGTNHGIVRVTPSGVVSLDLLDAKAGSEVTAIFEDLDGDIWFGGPHGLQRLRNSMFTTYSTADGLPPGGYGAIYVDATGRTWLAPLSGGLYWMWDGQVGHITSDDIDHDVVYSISGGNGDIVVGRQRRGLTVLSERGNTFSARTYSQAEGLAQNSVYSILRDRDGTLWAGTLSGGISKLQAGKFTNYSAATGLISDSVTSVVEGFDGTMWFATAGGLASLSNGRWKYYTTREGLPSNAVRTVFQDTRHVLWIVTAGGLAYLSSGRVGVPENLPDPLREQIFGIAEDEMGMLWFTTSDHVLRVNKERLLNGLLSETDVQIYGVDDGLPEVEGVARDRSVVADHSGRVWLSLTSSLCLADPTLTYKNAVPAATRIESATVSGHDISPQKPFEVPPGMRTISFAFAGTNLAMPARTRFRYKLDGSGQQWSDIVATKQVVFSNLSPGKYVFRIIASNPIGLWNGPETSLPFIVEPSFWQTWWFFTLCVVASLSLLWALYLVRLRQITASLRLRHQERLDERENIARDLHDTFFQSVQSLFLRLHTATNQLPSRDPARQALEALLDDSDRVMREGRETFLDLSTQAKDSPGLSELLADCCAEFSAAHPIEYRIEINGQPRQLNPTVSNELSKIAREALSNAFKHAEADAIEVDLSYGSNDLRLRVRDNGKGFDPARIPVDAGPRHLGLANMRKRAKTIEATLNLWSRMGLGTELEAIVPGTHAYVGKSRSWALFLLHRKS
jgi:signal transduction histidine kinase/ligand-binding sensor domain-containing protein